MLFINTYTKPPREGMRYSYGRYLTQGELRSLSLGAPARLILMLRGAVRLGAAKPRRFRAPVDFYLVKGERGYFISYKQGWHGVFYAPEEDGE